MTLIPSLKETSNLWKSIETRTKYTSNTAMLRHNIKKLKPITIDPFVASIFVSKQAKKAETDTQTVEGLLKDLHKPN